MTDSLQELTLDLDEDLYYRLAAEADEKGIPADQYISELIIEYMMEMDSEEDVVC